MSAAVSNMAHANGMAICAAESAMPTCAITIVLHSEMADAAAVGTAVSTAGSQAGLPVIRSWQYC